MIETNGLTRRSVLAASLAGLAGGAAAAPIVRLGVLPYGAVQWIAAVITARGLDQQAGFTLRASMLADTGAARLALSGGAVDVAFSDWPFVAEQRAHGGDLCLAAGGSASLGAMMVPAKGGLSGLDVGSLRALRGQRIGVAGGPADKSWKLVHALAAREGVDAEREMALSFGAAPLLDGLLRAGRLDAVLSFWNFAARLAADGYIEAFGVADAARALGLARPPVLLGFVFGRGWADAHKPLIGGFLSAADAACTALKNEDAAWAQVRPLMKAPGDAVFQALRSRFLAGLDHPDAAGMLTEARHMEQAIAVAGQAPATVPDGTFWPVAARGG